MQVVDAGNAIAMRVQCVCRSTSCILMQYQPWWMGASHGVLTACQSYGQLHSWQTELSMQTVRLSNACFKCVCLLGAVT